MAIGARQPAFTNTPVVVVIVCLGAKAHGSKGILTKEQDGQNKGEDPEKHANVSGKSVWSPAGFGAGTGKCEGHPGRHRALGIGGGAFKVDELVDMLQKGEIKDGKSVAGILYYLTFLDRKSVV